MPGKAQLIAPPSAAPHDLLGPRGEEGPHRNPHHQKGAGRGEHIAQRVLRRRPACVRTEDQGHDQAGQQPARDGQHQAGGVQVVERRAGALKGKALIAEDGVGMLQPLQALMRPGQEQRQRHRGAQHPCQRRPGFAQHRAQGPHQQQWHAHGVHQAARRIEAKAQPAPAGVGQLEALRAGKQRRAGHQHQAQHRQAQPQ